MTPLQCMELGDATLVDALQVPWPLGTRCFCCNAAGLAFPGRLETSTQSQNKLAMKQTNLKGQLEGTAPPFLPKEPTAHRLTTSRRLPHSAIACSWGLEQVLKPLFRVKQLESLSPVSTSSTLFYTSFPQQLSLSYLFVNCCLVYNRPRFNHRKYGPHRQNAPELGLHFPQLTC